MESTKGWRIMEKKDKADIIHSIKMVLTKDQIMTFVGGLHETQMN